VPNRSPATVQNPGYHQQRRRLKVAITASCAARTIADIEGGSGCVEQAHLAEALHYRRFLYVRQSVTYVHSTDLKPKSLGGPSRIVLGTENPKNPISSTVGIPDVKKRMKSAPPGIPSCDAQTPMWVCDSEIGKLGMGEK
jgi:hypothetical protein